FQFPEITLGILPGIGGCVFPYRKWPKGAALFNEMICLAKRINAREAADIGMVAQVSDGYLEMIRTAVEEVSRLVGKIGGSLQTGGKNHRNSRGPGGYTSLPDTGGTQGRQAGPQQRGRFYRL
ncbi:MAG: hypothetical protein JRJ82_24415, partial [Deltaproteobacteria bacterium]|nr:hypothetical protein [Deltaproteobacteria bacterium]